MTIEQILSIVIFGIMFIAIMWGKIHRFIPALIGGAVTILLIVTLVDNGPHTLWQVLRPYDFIHGSWWFGKHDPEISDIGGVNWQTIVFILGMMIMVEGLGTVGFFRWICLWTAKLVNYRVIPILIAFMLLSGFLSMFIDSITVMLFLAAITIELARMLKFDPVPMIIAEVFAANTGGSATMSGDPPNIIIGTSLGFTFADFITNTGPIALIGMLVALAFFYLCFRKILKKPPSDNSVTPDPSSYPKPGEAIKNPSLFRINLAIFFLVIVLLVTHAYTGLSVALIGVIAAVLILVVGRKERSRIIKGVDWRTLLFFLGLFVTVGGLEATGVLQKLAEFIEDASGGDVIIVMSFILWISAFASALIDNIPFAATMIPVIRNLSGDLGHLQPLAWSLSLGTDIGGNGTPIGASANVVGTAKAEEEGYHISWGRYCKYAMPAMILVVAICNVYLVLRYF